MQSLSQFEGYTEEQIKAALHMIGGSRRVAFRYELLDKNDNKKSDLKNVLQASIDHSAFSQIKRTARFTLKEENNIDYLTDKIKPYMRLFIPPGRVLARYYSFVSPRQPVMFQKLQESQNSGWVEFPLGVFHLSSPSRKSDGKMVIRDIEAFDGLVVLIDDKFTDRYTVTTGTKYYDAVVSILSSTGIGKYNIEYSDKALERDLEFEPGQEKLFAINELLRQINYDQLHVDVNGYYTSSTYRSPSIRVSDYSYITDNESVTFPGMEESLDLFSIPNKWVVVRSNAEQEPLRSEYTNENPDSPTSTVSRGRINVDYRDVQDIADQASLDAYTQRIAFEASQVFGYVNFETAIMPMHDFQDVLTLDFSELGIKEKYLETSWSFELREGSSMRHEARRVVQI